MRRETLLHAARKLKCESGIEAAGQDELGKDCSAANGNTEENVKDLNDTD